ncbi:unnamed protein product [Clavelina lepadiformis]|uniref:Dynein regulatory complex protein 9 n=1 Tax=Clavelina lepadiformis TaxID=159417 RepID=A0ABP0H3A0_CLALP
MAFSHSTAVHLAAIYEDCINQLSILGKIMPVSFQGKPEASQLVSGDIGTVLNSQKMVESKLDEALTARSEGKGRSGVQDLIESLASSNRFVDQSMRQSPLTKDNLFKVQEDRQFCEDVLVETHKELLVSHGFSSLVNAVDAECKKKFDLQQTIIKEEHGRRKIKQLQRQVQDIRKEKEQEIQQRNEMIAHLKDQLQEMKAKSNMEGKYVKKNAENQVHQNQQRCVLSEQKLKEELDTLKTTLDEEVRTHHEIENYLKNHQKLLEEEVEYWMDKYDKDVEAKQHELSVLKTSKANDLERLQELTRKYAEYEKVVVEDRIEKEKERRKKEQEELELNSAVRLQAWWRGTMVVKQMGPFNKKKKKGGKGKKGKKGKKKK